MSGEHRQSCMRSQELPWIFRGVTIFRRHEIKEESHVLQHFFYFAFYVAGGVWKSRIMSLKTHKSTGGKKTFLGLSNTSFSRSEGRRPVVLAVICLRSGSVIGQCQVEQRSRIPPCIPRAQCNSQSSWSMSWTEPLEHASQWFPRKEDWRKAWKKCQGRWFLT